MKTLTIFILSCFVAIGCVAQKSDTLITYNFSGIPTKKINKTTSVYQVFKRDSTSWVRTTSDKNLIPLKRETFSDSTLTNLYGTYILYQDGKSFVKGTYINNKKAGAWVTYDAEAQAKETKVYILDLLNGPYVSYWPNSSVFEQKEYINDKVVGERKLFYQNGNIALKENFNDKSVLVDSMYLDQDGKKTSKQNIEVEPQYPGGINKLYQFIAKQLKYPEAALRANAQGKVFLSFIVDELGELKDITLIQTPHPSLGKEAIRVIKYSPKWIPGKILGRPTSMKFNINVNFTLG